LFNANVKQVINVSQIFAKKMIEEKIKGSIVNVSSQVTEFYFIEEKIRGSIVNVSSQVTRGVYI
jgi:NAD(P)-dependent dehydrogenase (short-subunit alcohol dehydrogenase family)